MKKTREKQSGSKQHRRKREHRRWKLVRSILALAAILLAVNIFFQISNIQVEGNVLYSNSEVVEASGLKLGKSSLAVSEWLVVRRIYSALPGISGATVSLIIPDTLRIRVTETPAIAVLETENGTVLLSEHCQVVGGYAGDESELIHIRGIRPVQANVGEVLGVSAGESTKLDYLQELIPKLKKEGMLEDVENIDISNVSDLRFRYEGRFSVRLGEQEKLSNKLELLRQIVASLNIGDTGILDMSTEHEGHYIPG